MAAASSTITDEVNIWGDTLLHIAVKDDDIAQVKALWLRESTKTTTTNNIMACADGIGNLAIHVACTSKATKCLSFFLDNDCFDVNAGGYRTKPPVLLAAEQGFAAGLEMLMEKKETNVPPLTVYAAVQAGSVGCVRSLVVDYRDRIRDIDAKDNKGRTALYLACEVGSTDMITLLLEAGAQLTTANDGRDPLHVACDGRFSACVASVAEHGVDVNGTTAFGKTPLMIAAVENHDIDTVRALLLSETIEVDMKTGFDWSVLNALVSTRVRSGRTAQDSISIACALIDAKANVNQRTRHGHTLLMASCSHSPEMFNFMLTQGACFKHDQEKKALIDGSRGTLGQKNLERAILMQVDTERAAAEASTVLLSQRLLIGDIVQVVLTFVSA